MTIQQSDPDRLYKLLPDIDRINDATCGEPLRALLRIISQQADLLRIDVQELWNNFFIETCDRWVVPYIGDLVGNRMLNDVDAVAADETALSLFTDLAGPDLRPISKIRTRADVAKTIYYRRRKGTVSMLEQLAQDVTGWCAHAVEFFTEMTWNQNVNHLRPIDTGCFDLRSVEACSRVDGPFDPASHTADVRPLDDAVGWYGTLNIGFFLWRLNRYAVGNAARPSDNARPRAFSQPYRMTFSPLGNDAPLFINWSEQADSGNTSGNVPGPIPVPLYDEAPQTFYPGSFSVASNGVVIVPALVSCRNLQHWEAAAQPPGSQMWVDVGRGRLMVGSDYDPAQITVSYCYGFPADMGGGPYDRHKWMTPLANHRLIRVPADAATLSDALTLWAANKAIATIIRIASNDDQRINPTLDLDPLAPLAIEADNAYRPHLIPASGLLVVKGVNAANMLTLSGLLIEGGVSIQQDLHTLRIIHSTLVPGRSIAFDGRPAPPPPPPPPTSASLEISGGAVGAPINAGLSIQIAFSIVGPIRAPDAIEGLWLLDSIVDAIGDVAIADAAGSRGPSTWIERSTVAGPTFFKKLYASESIFTGTVSVEQHVDGCVRFSFVPPGSTAPRQYRCQPALETGLQQDAYERAAASSGTPLPPGWDAQIAARVAAWLVPGFESVRYGDPAYMQLRQRTPVQISEGSADGAEMGAFNHLKQPQRAGNLQMRLQEYLPFGLVAGLMYVT